MDFFTQRERLRAIQPILEHTTTVTAAAEQLGVSRKTLHTWLRRYQEGGVAGLADRSSAPLTTPHAVSIEQASEIIALRCQHPTWGPKKLRAWLARKYPRTAWPVPSTMGDLLRRRGLVRTPRRRAAYPKTPRAAFKPALQPNDTWCLDFKGHFALGRGGRCHPLTVQDLVSRFLLAAFGLPAERDALAWPVFERLFRERGLPATVRHDNGGPFASTGIAGLSRLGVRFLRLGIHVERTTPASPAQNGKLERMHRVLKLEATSPPADTMALSRSPLTASVGSTTRSARTRHSACRRRRRCTAHPHARIPVACRRSSTRPASKSAASIPPVTLSGAAPRSSSASPWGASWLASCPSATVCTRCASGPCSSEFSMNGDLRTGSSVMASLTGWPLPRVTKAPGLV
jgi:transposase-like protein